MNVAREPIAWERMAEPQDDQYDTEVTLALASSSKRLPAPGGHVFGPDAFSMGRIAPWCARPRLALLRSGLRAGRPGSSECRPGLRDSLPPMAGRRCAVPQTSRHDRPVPSSVVHH